MFLSTDLPVSLDYASPAPSGTACGSNRPSISRDPKTRYTGIVPPRPHRDRHSHTRTHEPTCLPSASTIIRTTAPPASRRQRQPPLTRPPPPRSQAGGFARRVRAAHPDPKTALTGRLASMHTYRQTTSPASRISQGGRSWPTLAQEQGLCRRGHEGGEPWLLPPATIVNNTKGSCALLTGQNCGVFAPVSGGFAAIRGVEGGGGVVSSRQQNKKAPQ